MEKIIFILILCPTFLFSQLSSKDINTLFAQISKENTAGCALLVVQGDKKIFEKAKGWANEARSEKLTPLSNFRMASVSKQFTAMSILILEKQGKLSFDDPLIKFFPDFSPVGKTIKIKHLLNHSSGLIDYEALMSDTLTRQLSDTDVLNMVKNIDSTYFKAGESYRYSNGAYCLMTLIVERVSGQSFTTFMAEHIFQPLGMAHTQIFDNQAIKNRAYGFAKNKKGQLAPRDQSLTSATQGDGGVYTSLNDYFLWYKALQNNSLVSLDSIRQLHKNPLPQNKGFYNIGWFFNDEGELFHSGSTCGFSNVVIYMPKKRVLVAFFSNIADNHKAFRPIYDYLRAKKVVQSDIWQWHDLTN
ncbi:MAG: beta-lactamase family protein [Saprospiraceae bacterium]|nr:beta-lactamase family protein [Saprospiraceae bacterium]